MIGISTRGDDSTSKALQRMQRGDIFGDLDHYGRLGVNALAAATPTETGATKIAWGYRVIRSRKWPGVEWFNTNPAGGESVAVLIQYGHATRNGGYVQGRDFINRAMQPIFDQIISDVWKKVLQ